MINKKLNVCLLITCLFNTTSIYTQPKPINEPTPATTTGDFYRSDEIHYACGKNKLDWYGSGDVNNDEKIDSLDVAAMDTTSSYRADVDGDGTPGTPNDKKTLEDYLNGTTDHLPGEWNELKTTEEMEDWIRKMIPIEKQIREEQHYTCQEDDQSFVNFNGVSNISGFVELYQNEVHVLVDSTANGLLSIPVRYIGLKEDDSKPMKWNNGVLTKPNPLDEKSYFVWNPTTGEEISTEEVLSNKYVYIGATKQYAQDQFTFTPDIIEFENENGFQQEVRGMNAYVLRNSPKTASIKLTAPEEITINKETYEAHPNLLNYYAYGNATVESNPEEGEDFYFIDDVTNYINGSVASNITKSLVDTTYLNSDSTLFSVKKKFFGELFEKDESGNENLGTSGTFWIKSLGAKDSAYQTITVDLSTDVAEEGGLEKTFNISNNYPNPFNPTTVIEFSLSSTEYVQLIVFNSIGQKVRNLINGIKHAGNYRIIFNGENLSSGIYFYKIICGSNIETKKMILLK